MSYKYKNPLHVRKPFLKCLILKLDRLSSNTFFVEVIESVSLYLSQIYLLSKLTAKVFPPTASDTAIGPLIIHNLDYSTPELYSIFKDFPVYTSKSRTIGSTAKKSGISGYPAGKKTSDSRANSVPAEVKAKSNSCNVYKSTSFSTTASEPADNKPSVTHIETVQEEEPQAQNPVESSLLLNSNGCNKLASTQNPADQTNSTARKLSASAQQIASKLSGILKSKEKEQKSAKFPHVRGSHPTFYSIKKKISGQKMNNNLMNLDIAWDEVVTEQVHHGKTGVLEKISYTQCSMVGHGSFGVVFQTKLQPSNEIAAIKRVLQDKRFKNRELQVMKLVHHRNIVDLKYYFYSAHENDLYLNLILEYVPETLYKSLRHYFSKGLIMPPLEIKLYTYQMLRALNYIHAQGICHRDIKPQNLLIDPDTCVLKLCDFGSAKLLNPAESNVSYICSRYYRAPELIFGATNYTTQIDVWSAGCVMAELILGQPLFPGDSGIDQLVEIIKILGTPSKEQIKFMNPNYMEHKFPQIKPIPLNRIFKRSSGDCIELLSKILNYSPVDRITCVESLCEKYFDELRAEDLKLPVFRRSVNGNNEIREPPELFDFDLRELSIRPDLNHKLVPSFAVKRLIDVDLNNFIPLTKEQLKVTLE